jgi:hypothetical protein
MWWIMKRNVTAEVYIEISIPYSKRFVITLEVDKVYPQDEDEIMEMFSGEAKKLMDEHLNNDFNSERDLDLGEIIYTDESVDYNEDKEM